MSVAMTPTMGDPPRFARLKTEDGSVHLVHEQAAFDWADKERPAVIVRCGARLNFLAFDRPVGNEPLCPKCWEPK